MITKIPVCDIPPLESRSDVNDLKAKKQYCKLHVFAKSNRTEIFLYTQDGYLLPGNNGKTRQAGIGVCRTLLSSGVYQIKLGKDAEPIAFELLDDMLLREE